MQKKGFLLHIGAGPKRDLLGGHHLHHLIDPVFQVLPGEGFDGEESWEESEEESFDEEDGWEEDTEDELTEE